MGVGTLPLYLIGSLNSNYGNASLLTHMKVVVCKAAFGSLNWSEQDGSVICSTPHLLIPWLKICW